MVFKKLLNYLGIYSVILFLWDSQLYCCMLAVIYLYSRPLMTVATSLWTLYLSCVKNSTADFVGNWEKVPLWCDEFVIHPVKRGFFGKKHALFHGDTEFSCRQYWSWHCFECRGLASQMVALADFLSWPTFCVCALSLICSLRCLCICDLIRYLIKPVIRCPVIWKTEASNENADSCAFIIVVHYRCDSAVQRRNTT